MKQTADFANYADSLKCAKLTVQTRQKHVITCICVALQTNNPGDRRDKHFPQQCKQRTTTAAAEYCPQIDADLYR